MFTWICPKCGREVPPSYTDCPNCHPQQAAPPAPGAPAPGAPAPPPPPPPAPQQPAYAPPQPPSYPPPAYQPPPPPPGYAPQQPVYNPPPAYNPPPPAYAQQPPSYAPPPPPPSYEQPAYAPPQQQSYEQPPYAQSAPVYVEPPQRRTPEWLVMILVAVGSVAIFALAYFYLLPSMRKGNAAAPAATKTAGMAAGKQHPYAKFLELTGIRLVEDEKQNVQAKFLLVNHSTAELAGVTLNVTLKPVNATPDTPPVTEFSFKLPTLGPYESREVTVPAKTKLRAYEMPDWQFIQSDVQITSSK